MAVLPTLGGNNGAASDINDRGQIVGIAENTTRDLTCVDVGPPFNQVDQIEEKPVLWQGGIIKELPTYSGDPDGGANALNESGWLVGNSGKCSKGPDYSLHALLWHDGALVELGNLGGTLFSFAGAINNRNQIVGASNLSGDATFHAFLWTNDAGMQDLGTLPGDSSSLARGINDKGQVIGQSCDVSGNCRAFLWQNGVMIDLNNLVPSGGSTLFLFEAFGINSSGQIAVGGFDANTGDCCAFLATPAFGSAPLGGTITGSGIRDTSVIPDAVRRFMNQATSRPRAFGRRNWR